MKEHQAGIGAKELCRKYGISDGTFYKWRSKYGGMEVSEPATDAPAEIGFANGRTLRCPPGMAEAEIIQLIRLVETA